MTVVREASAAAAPTWEAWTRSDDMHDSLAEVRGYLDNPATRPLGQALEICRDVIERPFALADHQANERQRRFKLIATFASYTGATAVMLAIVHLAVEEVFGGFEWWRQLLRNVFIAESLMTAITLVLVAAGVLMYVHEGWLLERFKAEQLRLLKFCALIEPELWKLAGVDLERWRRALAERVEEIEGYRHPAISNEAASEQLPEVPTPAEVSDLNREAVVALATYYDRKRLAFQRKYFARKASAHVHNSRVPLFVFAVSITFVVAHVVLELAHQERLSAALVAASAVVPAWYAGARNRRSASESSRNVTRSTARHAALCQIDDRLEKAMADDPERVDLRLVFWNLRMCEFVLESDQREWLRLMREAEWIA
ncbi:MAG: hypothetical protein ACREON_15470 [Gemmatimonadaceae bacterium]